MRAVFLDRDGVLNDVVFREGRPGSPRALCELTLPTGGAQAVASLRAAGYLTFVVTNQPDLARNQLREEDHEAIMERITETYRPDDALVCPHDDHHECACRKPRPGMLRTLAERWGVTLPESYIIGDSWKDIDAGRAAGCRTVLIRRDYNEGVEAEYTVKDLQQASDLILGGGAR